MNLYVRVALGMLLSMILSMAAIRIVLVGQMHERQEHLRRQQVSASTQILAERVDMESDKTKVLGELSRHFEYDLKIVPVGDVDPAMIDAAGGSRFDASGDLVYVPLSKNEVLIAGPLPQFRRAFQGWIALAISLAIVMLTAFLVVGPIVRRLRGLERATTALRKGDLKARADVPGGDAIGSLAQHFNEMAEELERHADNQQQLLQAVSHEFRTPNARIRFALEMLESAPDAPTRKKRVDDIEDSLSEIDALVDELLTYVRFDGKTPDLKTEVIPVADVLKDIIEDTKILRTGVEVSLVSHGENQSEVVANRRYFRRVVENLVLNAMRHAESKVSVEYQEVEDFVVVLVHDDGPGVPENQRSRVFEPFARLDSSRSRESGGVGLGLAIVRRIMQWHGGNATVDDSELGGAMFVTTWPIESDAT